MADLKRVYAAPTEEIALSELDSFDEKWSGKYPKIAKCKFQPLSTTCTEKQLHVHGDSAPLSRA